MSGPFSDEYHTEACTQIETQDKLEAWGVVEIDDDMNIILYTWELNIKRLPDGLVKKCKAQFCACGDQNL